ncbi:MAG: argininosuccinate lyase [Aggregatilineales bacterium]
MTDSQNQSSGTLWAGRYEHGAAESLRKLNDSLPFDKRMYAEDIQGSIAWAKALARASVLTDTEAAQIEDGLIRVKAEFEAGAFVYAPSDEDIHTAVERRLTELIGPVAGKLHTGRSRNDQVATDLRLWLFTKTRHLQRACLRLQYAIYKQAGQHTETLMPGYTHMRAAQPIIAGHWLMSYVTMFARDQDRLEDCERSTSKVSPLGSGALAGTAYPIDRFHLADDLDMENESVNSLDAVADRDFVVEFLSAAALLMVHLSRFAEDVILYSSPQFGFINLDERYTTGSSLMPQKQNPDVLELARGKTGRIIGHLTGFLTTLKGLPSTYNKDLQEDKEPLFDTVDTLETLLPALIGLVETMTFNPDKMRAALDESMLATDLADYLVGKGVPFREAHGLVGKAVRRSIDTNTPLSKLPIEDYRAISDKYDTDLYAVFDYMASVNKRNAIGGTAPDAVKQQIDALKLNLKIYDGEI